MYVRFHIKKRRQWLTGVLQYLTTDSKIRKASYYWEQLISSAIEVVLKTVLHIPAYVILKKNPLSNNAVQRRNDELSHDVESYMYNLFANNLLLHATG